jgi:hypothetical protein
LVGPRKVVGRFSLRFVADVVEDLRFKEGAVTHRFRLASHEGFLATFVLLELELKLEPLLMLLAAVKLRGARGAAIEWFDLLYR